MMTVATERFNSSGETTMQGRVLAVSAPAVGSSRTRKMLNRSITISTPCRQTHWSNHVWQQDHRRSATNDETLWSNLRGLCDAGAAPNHCGRFALPNHKASDAKPVQQPSFSLS